MALGYGARECGLLYGYLFDRDGGAREVGLADARLWLESGRSPEDAGFVWLHFDLTDNSAQRWMAENLEAADEFLESLRHASRSTRIEDAQNGLIAVINDVAYDFAFDPSEIATLWMSVTERVAITARVRPLRSIDRLRERVKLGERFATSMDLLNHLLRDQGDVLVNITREATVKVDAVEDGLLHGRPERHRAKLGALRRVLVRLQRLLAPEPAALFRLLRQPPGWVGTEDLDELRQSTEEFSLVIRDLAALQERIKLLQEEIAAQVSEQTNRSLFTLTMVTVLALPINITTGFFGMNVGGVPLADHPHGFALLVFLVALFTGLAGWIAFRRRL